MLLEGREYQRNPSSVQCIKASVSEPEQNKKANPAGLNWNSKLGRSGPGSGEKNSNNNSLTNWNHQVALSALNKTWVPQPRSSQIIVGSSFMETPKIPEIIGSTNSLHLPREEKCPRVVKQIA